jgi:hypothetical protein
MMRCRNTRADALHVLRRDVAAPIKERVCARTEGKINGGPRRSRSESDLPAADCRCPVRVAQTRPDVIFHAIVDVDIVNDVARGDDASDRLQGLLASQAQKSPSNQGWFVPRAFAGAPMFNLSMKRRVVPQAVGRCLPVRLGLVARTRNGSGSG